MSGRIAQEGSARLFHGPGQGCRLPGFLHARAVRLLGQPQEPPGPGGEQTLFGIDTTNDRVSLRSPANSGTLPPTGNLGVDAGPSAGCDSYYAPKNGTNHGFAALKTRTAYRFHAVNILDGDAGLISTFLSSRRVFDTALPLDQG